MLDTAIIAMKFDHLAVEWQRVSLCAMWLHLLSNHLMNEAFPISKMASRAWVAAAVIFTVAANHY